MSGRVDKCVVNLGQMENRSWLVDSLTYDTYCQGQGVPHTRERNPSPSKEFSAVTAVPSLHTILSRPVPGVPGHPVLQHLVWVGCPKDPPQMDRKGRVIEGRGGRGRVSISLLSNPLTGEKDVFR